MASSPRTPRNTPHTFSANRAGASSPLASPLGGKSRSAESPLLARTDETTYHRRLRTLLLDARRARTIWGELVSYDGMKAAIAVVEKWEKVEEARSLDRNSNSAPVPGFRRDKTPSGDDPVLGVGGQQERLIGRALVELEVAMAALTGVVQKIQKQTAKLEALADAADALLLETSKAKGMEFAFKEAMWGTWSMERFVSALVRLTSQFVLSDAHLQKLASILNAPLPPPKSSNGAFRARSGPDSPFSAPGRTGQTTSDSAKGDLAARRKALTEWEVLPFLERRGKESEAWLDELCEVEVGRWAEGK